MIYLKSLKIIVEDLNAAFLVLLNSLKHNSTIISINLFRALESSKKKKKKLTLNVSTYLMFISILTCSSFSCVPPLLLRNANSPTWVCPPGTTPTRLPLGGNVPYDSLIGRAAWTKQTSRECGWTHVYHHVIQPVYIQQMKMTKRWKSRVVITNCYNAAPSTRVRFCVVQARLWLITCF